MTIKITGVTRLNREPNKAGVQHLAHFDAELGGVITLENALLVDSPEGRKVWMMRADKAAGNAGVRLSKSVRRAVAEAASEALEALDSITPKETPALSAAVELVRQIEERDAA